MKHLALSLVLLAATAACDSANPTEPSPSLSGSVLGSGGRSDDAGGDEDDGGLLGPGSGRSVMGSGMGDVAPEDGGIVGSGGGRAEDGLVGSGGRSVVGSGG